MISWGGHKGGLGGHLPPPACMLKKALRRVPRKGDENILLPVPVVMTLLISEI